MRSACASGVVAGAALLALTAIAVARPGLEAHRFVPPRTIPADALGAAIKQGEDIFVHTQTSAKKYVGDGLECESCHLNRGRLENSAPMWAAFISYPKFVPRSGKVESLEERIADCFRFSMNGHPPGADSATMIALVSYFRWLDTGARVGARLAGSGYPRLPKPRLAADPDRGLQVFRTHCALCHGVNGAGRKAAGVFVFPPLWGAQSYNWGASMHQVGTAAAFIKANMPLGLGGTLADQQAWDVAAYIDSQPRPQDPRFTGSVEQTRRKYHAAADDYYGRMEHGQLLGGPNP